MMTKIDTSTEVVEVLLKDVTDGPWEAALERGCHGVIAQSLPKGGANFVALVGNDVESPEKEPSRFANATFIAASRQLVPALLAERDQLRDELDAAYAIIAAERGEVIKLREVVLKIANIGVAWSDTFESQISQALTIAGAALSKKDQSDD